MICSECTHAVPDSFILVLYWLRHFHSSSAGLLVLVLQSGMILSYIPTQNQLRGLSDYQSQRYIGEA